MSNFIRDVSARSRDVPLNGLPAVYEDYTYPSDTTDSTNSGDEIGLKSHIFNQQPIQQVDTYYNNLYRYTIEKLRTCTETWNDYHNSNAVPFYIKKCVSVRINDDSLHMRDNVFYQNSQSFVPDSSTFVVEDRVITDKEFVSTSEITTTKRFSYRLNFNPYMNNVENMVNVSGGRCIKFINGTIHIVSGWLEEPTEGVEDSGVLDTLQTLQNIIQFDIPTAIAKSKFNDTFLIDIAPTINDEIPLRINASTALDPGTLIDTGIPCTQEELWKSGIIAPFLFFIDGHPMAWENVVFTTDKMNTYVTFIIRSNHLKNLVSNDPDISCVGFPFPVLYMKPNHWDNSKIVNKYDLFSWIDSASDPEHSDYIRYSTDRTEYTSGKTYGIFAAVDDIYVEDLNVDFSYLEKANSTSNPLYYNVKINNLPYQNKIKRFNIFTTRYLGFCKSDSSARGVLCGEEDDSMVDLTWHPFNHLKINVNKDLIDKVKDEYKDGSIDRTNMLFRIFYNKKVVYDQDNIMRIRNKQKVDEDYEAYVASLESNIKLFIDRIYDLAQDPEYDIHMTIMHFDNMEEGSTPTDEFIWYGSPVTKDKLHELADEMFATDSLEVRNCISSIIDEASSERFDTDALDEWCLRRNLPEMFAYGDNMDLIINNMGLLEEVFDYKYRDYNNYFRDVYEATDYILGYDPDKLESSIIYPTYSYTKTGAELYAEIYEDETYGESLAVPMANSGTRESYLMLFHNGELYHRYDSIRYTGLDVVFQMEKIVDCQNDDSIWEFVWFRNVNNDVYNAEYDERTEDFCTMYDSVGNIITTTNTTKFVACNTSMFDPEDLMVMTNVMDNNPYNTRIAEETQDPTFPTTKYPLFYEIYSYEAHHEPTHMGVFKYAADYKLNGLHRVTRQGGGQYFILPKRNISQYDYALPYTEPFPNPDRMAAYKSRPGLGSHCFAFCSDIDNSRTGFRGTPTEFGNIAKDNSWFYNMPATTILCNGGATVPIVKEEE